MCKTSPSIALGLPQRLMAFNADASLLATASTKGTVIRVHRLPQVHRHMTALLDAFLKLAVTPV